MRNFILVIIAISSSLWQLTASARPKAKIRSAEPVLVSKAAQACINSHIKGTELKDRDERLSLVKWRFRWYHTNINLRLGLDEIKASRARACMKVYALKKGDTSKEVTDLHYCLERYGLRDKLVELSGQYTWFASWLGFNLDSANDTEVGGTQQVLDCEKLLDPPPNSISDYRFQALSALGQVCARGLFNNELDVINFDKQCRNYQTELYYLVNKYKVDRGEGQPADDKVATVFAKCFSIDGEFEWQVAYTDANNQHLAIYENCIKTYGDERMLTDMKNLLNRFADNLSSRWNKRTQIDCFLK